MDKIRKEYIRGCVKVAPTIDKLKGNKLSRYCHIMRRNEKYRNGNNDEYESGQTCGRKATEEGMDE